jgi:hypothetical protein
MAATADKPRYFMISDDGMRGKFGMPVSRHTLYTPRRLSSSCAQGQILGAGKIGGCLHINRLGRPPLGGALTNSSNSNVVFSRVD